MLIPAPSPNGTNYAGFISIVLQLLMTRIEMAISNPLGLFGTLMAMLANKQFPSASVPTIFYVLAEAEQLGTVNGAQRFFIKLLGSSQPSVRYAAIDALNGYADVLAENTLRNLLVTERVASIREFLLDSSIQFSEELHTRQLPKKNAA
jgi:hypothetical protein